jgi:hypothetical protein
MRQWDALKSTILANQRPEHGQTAFLLTLLDLQPFRPKACGRDHPTEADTRFYRSPPSSGPPGSLPPKSRRSSSQGTPNRVCPMRTRPDPKPVLCAGKPSLFFTAGGYLRYRQECLTVDCDTILTAEWFGSGPHTAFQEVLISNRFARLILEQGWRGLHLKPIKLI